MTLAAFVGARSFGDRKIALDELRDMIATVFSDNFTTDKMKKYVILFLEGDFGSHTNSKKMIMEKLQRSIHMKMRWLTVKCRSRFIYIQ